MDCSKNSNIIYSQFEDNKFGNFMCICSEFRTAEKAMYESVKIAYESGFNSGVEAAKAAANNATSERIIELMQRIYTLENQIQNLSESNICQDKKIDLP